jgi:hypothetical protein
MELPIPVISPTALLSEKIYNFTTIREVNAFTKRADGQTESCEKNWLLKLWQIRLLMIHLINTDMPFPFIAHLQVPQ